MCVCVCVCLSVSVLMKDRCKLFCRVAGSTAYYQLRDRVIDGTPCGPDTNDICVQGLCRVRRVSRAPARLPSVDFILSTSFASEQIFPRQKTTTKTQTSLLPDRCVYGESSERLIANKPHASIYCVCVCVCVCVWTLNHTQCLVRRFVSLASGFCLDALELELSSSSFMDLGVRAVSRAAASEMENL